MKKTLKNKLFISFLILMLVLVVLINYPIFLLKDNINDTYLNDVGKDINVYILEYHYTTGSGWLVVDSTNKDMVKKEVALYSAFDPRFLKDNNDFDLDYTGMLLVESKRIEDMVLDGENITVLFADEITVVFNVNRSHYSILDLRIEGIIKSILGIFNRKFRLSY